MSHRLILPMLALGILLTVSAWAQHEAMGHHAMPGKADYDDPGGGDPDPPAGCQGVQAKITIGPATFSPSTITVQAGQPVCWTWAGTQHNVSANDGSFSSGPPEDSGNFQVTFNTPGTIGYHCQVHGTASSGMRGTVIVTGGDPGGEEEVGPGKLELLPATYTLSEGAGTVTVTVQRMGGSEGAASVKIGTVGGTAKKGSDFINRNATLKWKDGEKTPKSFLVKLKNDKVREQEETFTIRLTKATRATMGISSATVTIQDDDGAAVTRALAAPAGLRAAGQSASEIHLIWAADSTAASAFRIERSPEGGAFEEIASVPAAARGFTDSGLPGDTTYQYRVRAEGIEGLSAYSGIAAGATDGLPGPCNDARSLCLKDGRFEATVRWRVSEEGVEADAKGMLLPETPGSGLFSFSQDGGDLQLLLNVRDGCADNGHYWLDFAAATDAELLVKVRDTLTGRTWVHFNPEGSVPASIRDVDAFATCP